MTDPRPSDFGLDLDTIDEFSEMMGDDAHLLDFGDSGCTLNYRLGDAPEQVRAAALEAVSLLLGFDKGTPIARVIPEFPDGYGQIFVTPGRQYASVWEGTCRTVTIGREVDVAAVVWADGDVEYHFRTPDMLMHRAKITLTDIESASFLLICNLLADGASYIDPSVMTFRRVG